MDGLSEMSKKATRLPFLELLKKLYPSVSWNSSSLLNVPQDTWKDQKKTRDFLETLEPMLFISKKEDWYHVSRKQLQLVGARPCLEYFGSRIGTMLQFGFPEISWDVEKFSNRRKKASQRWLLEQVTNLYPGQEIISNYRFNPRHEDSCGHSYSMKVMEFDIWVPKLQLALEYQGEHHYHNFKTFIGGNLTLAEHYQQLDDMKRNL
eukprot:TRINITY_DN2601_c0_g1_i7.p1 TRINITY_DN2601_c0_g1~~TRINITY_DN2601_c0_g1_i7.p1  ORF type:complete len:206 (+),score=40.79 TRINITY_DN2601_c0_g1_i7:143-760(+)